MSSSGSTFNYPILFPADEMTKDIHFQSLGLGALGEATSCFVTEERNGSYELEMKYPVDGIRFKDLKVDNLIVAPTTPDTMNTQVFRIYSISKPTDNIVTVKAEHISYLLNKVTVLPFKATNCAMAMVNIQSHIVWDTTDKYFPKCPFSFYSDINDENDFELDKPSTVRSLLGSSSDSLLSTYQGEFKFDNFNVSLLNRRGHDTDVVLTYGKNINTIESTDDASEVYTGIVPYWKGTITTSLHSSSKDNTDEYGYTSQGQETVTKDTTVFLDPKILWTNHRKDYAYPLVVPVDLTQEDKQKDDSENNVYITAEQRRQALRKNAMAYLSKNGGWKLKTNIKITATNLWETEEYENFTAIQRAELCDTVKVVYPKLGIETSLMVTKVKYNVLLNRYDTVELGEPKSSFTASVIDTARNTSNAQRKETNQFGITMQQRINRVADRFAPIYQDAVNYATDMINGAFNKFGGALAGYVVFNRAADGSVNEILIMDTPNKGTAKYVWRWNQGGLGHSHSGYYGPFDDVAITQDGRINATLITTGTLNAGVIKAGLITSLPVDENGNIVDLDQLDRVNYWDLVSGELHVVALEDFKDETSQNFENAKQARDALAAKEAKDNEAVYAAMTENVNKLNDVIDDKSSALSQSLAAQKKLFEDSQTQENIFNLLTNNGQIKGIYMADTNGDGRSDSLYMNADYIKTGTMSANMIKGGVMALGGNNNMYGTMYVLDPNQQIIGKWDNDGLKVGYGNPSSKANRNSGDSSWDIQEDPNEPWVCTRLNPVGVNTRQLYITNNMNDVTNHPACWIGVGNGAEVAEFRGSVNIMYGEGMSGGSGNLDVVTINGRDPSDLSDKRIKKNITPLDGNESYQFIMSLKPVSFEYNNDNFEQGKHHGFIAQDVKETLDELNDSWNVWKVSKKNKAHESIGLPDDVQELDYKQITSDLVSVVQQQQKKIDDLESRLKKLEDLVSGLT